MPPKPFSLPQMSLGRSVGHSATLYESGRSQYPGVRTRYWDWYSLIRVWFNHQRHCAKTKHCFIQIEEIITIGSGWNTAGRKRRSRILQPSPLYSQVESQREWILYISIILHTALKKYNINRQNWANDLLILSHESTIKVLSSYIQAPTQANISQIVMDMSSQDNRTVEASN